MKLGLLSDAHGNLEAFNLGVVLLRRLGAERLYFLGDAVGYFPGDAVIRALFGSDILSILGNHEAMLLTGEVDEQREPIYRLIETRQVLDSTLMEFLASWPAERRIDAPCGPLWFVHGSPADPTFAYVYPDSDLTKFKIEAGTTVFMGNTHRPFIREQGGARFVNVGSCGLPRDAGQLGAACLFDDESGDVKIVRFDITDVTAAALARCGPVHKLVAEVFTRPTPSNLVGTRYGN